MESNSIRTWSEDDRPREKFLKSGRHTLSDAELIAIVLRSGSATETALDLGRKLLRKANNELSGLSRMSVSEMATIKGIGTVKAITVAAALELGNRRAAMQVSEKTSITSSRDAAGYLQHRLQDLPHEEFWLLLLNRANVVITLVQLSKGGVTGTVVDPKMVFRTALEHLATGIILCHNHPSGNPRPSESDIRLTKKLRDAGALLEITILDHLIIAGTAYTSFADEGMLG